MTPRSKFARCMRENGVDMPDPKPGQRGIRLSQPKGVVAEQDARRPTRRAASTWRRSSRPRCREEQQKEFREAALANARCMREHGIDFPDPTFGENGEARIHIRRAQRHRSREREVPGGAEGVREHDAEAARRQ